MLKDLKEKLKKITNQLKTIDWKSWHLPKINFKFDKIFNFISSWWHILLAGFILFLCLYYPLGGWLTNNIDRTTTYEINTNNTKQSAGIEMASFIINREVNEKIWTPNLPFFFPAYILDNMPNFQLGMINATSDVVNSLSRRIDSPIINQEQNSFLQEAAELLRYDGKIWMFSAENKFAPSANTQYRKARKQLISYNRALNHDEQIFYRRTEDLTYILKKMNQNLRKSVNELDEHIREENTSWSDFKADDIFYYNQGKVYAYYLLLKALGQDYKEILIKKNIYLPWTKMLKAMEMASELDSVYIRNAEPNSLTAPNHLLYLAYYIEKAQNINKSIIRTLNKKEIRQ